KQSLQTAHVDDVVSSHKEDDESEPSKQPGLFSALKDSILHAGETVQNTLTTIQTSFPSLSDDRTDKGDEETELSVKTVQESKDDDSSKQPSLLQNVQESLRDTA
ncbi:unnamed protein product, partial [Didymodactylos carnosus]